MSPSTHSLRAPILGLALVALVGVVAIPALAASPSATPRIAEPTKAPERSEKSEAPETPAVVSTVRGVVAATKNADGQTEYTLTVAGKTLKLDAGPPWFFGDKHPLAPFVGKTVTVAGEQTGDELEVDTVDGVRLRAEGKPPWAGGWKAVGSAHPGWSQEKADRWAKHQADKAAKVGKDAAPQSSAIPRGN